MLTILDTILKTKKLLLSKVVLLLMKIVSKLVYKSAFKVLATNYFRF